MFIQDTKTSSSDFENFQVFSINNMNRPAFLCTTIDRQSLAHIYIPKSVENEIKLLY